jgi:hypothetical protein
LRQRFEPERPIPKSKFYAGVRKLYKRLILDYGPRFTNYSFSIFKRCTGWYGRNMKQILAARLWIVIGLSLAIPGSGCEGQPQAQEQGQSAQTIRAKTPTEQSGKGQPEAPEWKKTLLGKNVWLETRGDRRRVVVGAKVCLREGGFGLECLLCRQRTKEHESILSTDADAQLIHAALLAAKAKPGSPVQYLEKDGTVTVVPPAGQRIKVLIQYLDKGKETSVPAQQWILNSKTKKDLDGDWVFAGSKLFADPDDQQKKPVYAANTDGAYICVLNVPTALLDLPINNPNKDPEFRELQPHTARIPPLETKVSIILESETEAKKPTK